MNIYQQTVWRNTSTSTQIGFALLMLLICASTGRAQSNTFPSSGNAGVGTTSPGELLSVNNGAVGTYYDKANYGIRGIFQHSGNGSGILSAGGLQIAVQGTNNATNGSGDINFFVTNSNSTGASTDASYIQAMKIRYNGYVGIGTASPAGILHVLTTNAGDLSSIIQNTAAGDGRSVAFIASVKNTAGTQSSVSMEATAVAGANANLAFRTGGAGTGFGTQRMVIDGSGNVGIGTTSPSSHLHLYGNSQQVDIQSSTSTAPVWQRLYNGGGIAYIGVEGSTVGGFQTGSTPYATVIGSGASGVPLQFSTAGTVRTTIDSAGNVGIGKTNPSVALDVVGSINLTGTVNAKYQDVAEWVPSSEKLSTGTVVVLDSTKSNQVTSSTTSYDTRVAGVVSDQPGIALGEKSETKVLVATTGRVKVKVDASEGAIHIGDLLVTSDIPGVAMKSEPVNLGGVQIHRPGSLIGKALEPLEKGSGEILVLLSLQ